MKGKLTRLRLDVSDITEPVILGIASPDPDYKLSLKLNKKLNISLRNSSPMEITAEGDQKTAFTKFSYITEADNVTFHLVSNRSGRNLLLRSLKNIDFFLFIYDQGSGNETSRLVEQIREVENITGVFRLDAKALKDKDFKFLSHISGIAAGL